MQAFSYGKLLTPSNGLRDVERKAQRCLAYCQHKLGLDEVPLPVPVDEWIETAMDIRFGVDNLSHLGPNVLGAAFIRNREILVSESVLTDEGRFRFTCAHELGHFVLHADKCDVFKDTHEPGTDFSEQIERHADRFAAAFLMPIPLVEQELVRCLQDVKLDPTTALADLMTSTDQSDRLWKVVVLPALRRRFVVSQTALVIRLRGLCLLSDLRRSLLPARCFHDFMDRVQVMRVVDELKNRMTEPDETDADGD